MSGPMPVDMHARGRFLCLSGIWEKPWATQGPRTVLQPCWVLASEDVRGIEGTPARSSHLAQATQPLPGSRCDTGGSGFSRCVNREMNSKLLHEDLTPTIRRLRGSRVCCPQAGGQERQKPGLRQCEPHLRGKPGDRPDPTHYKAMDQTATVVLLGPGRAAPQPSLGHQIWPHPWAARETSNTGPETELCVPVDP